MEPAEGALVLDDDELLSVMGSMRAIAPAGYRNGTPGHRALRKFAEEYERRKRVKREHREREAIEARKRGSRRGELAEPVTDDI